MYSSHQLLKYHGPDQLLACVSDKQNHHHSGSLKEETTPSSYLSLDTSVLQAHLDETDTIILLNCAHVGINCVVSAQDTGVLLLVADFVHMPCQELSTKAMKYLKKTYLCIPLKGSLHLDSLN